MNIGWVIGSYFLVSGGFVLAFIGQMILPVPPEKAIIGFYGLAAVASLFGGMVAARASKGDTILEPALGALLFIGSLVATFTMTTFGTAVAKLAGHAFPQDTTQFLAITGGCFFGGALVGAFLGERVGGDSQPGGIFKIAQSFFSVLGGMFIGVFAVALLMLQKASEGTKTSADDNAVMVLAGLAIGSALGGLTARRGGSGIGTTALGALMTSILFMVAFIDHKDGITSGGVVGGAAMICATVGAILGSIGMGKSDADGTTA